MLDRRPWVDEPQAQSDQGESCSLPDDLSASGAEDAASGSCWGWMGWMAVGSGLTKEFLVPQPGVHP